MKQIEQKFENAGKYCISKVYEGYHEWHVWRKSLYDFVPLLFRKKGVEADDIPEKKLPESQGRDSGCRPWKSRC